MNSRVSVLFSAPAPIWSCGLSDVIYVLQVNASMDYCPGMNWGYGPTCFVGDTMGASVEDAQTMTIPADCVVETSNNLDFLRPSGSHVFGVNTVGVSLCNLGF